MFLFNLQRLLADRGIHQLQSPYLSKATGFHRKTTQRLLGNVSKSLTLKQVEKLCIMLNCTPNDLIRWVPGKEEALPEDHALQSLKQKDDFDLASRLKNMSVKQLEKLKAFAREL